MTGLRVVIADDHPVFREGLRTLLTDIGAEVVGEAADGAAAVAAAEQTRPDVVLMDLTMPTTSGIEATRRLAHTMPDLPVLVLTMSQDSASLQAALAAGRQGLPAQRSQQDRHRAGAGRSCPWRGRCRRPHVFYRADPDQRRRTAAAARPANPSRGRDSRPARSRSRQRCHRRASVPRAEDRAQPSLRCHHQVGRSQPCRSRRPSPRRRLRPVSTSPAAYDSSAFAPRAQSAGGRSQSACAAAT